MKFDLKIEDLFQSVLNGQHAGNFELAIGQMIKGDRGYSAYELAVQDGFEGTTAEWLQSLVQPAEDAQEDANALMVEFQENETERIRLEGIRKTDETERIRLEDLRISAETDRNSAETLRLSKEIERIDAEILRVENELERIRLEDLRISAETIRKTNEIDRIATINGLTDTFDTKVDKTAITQNFGTDTTKVMSQKAVTDSISQILQLEGEELWAYGVKWTQGQESATLERIGNLNMHKTLPCHKTRGCLVLDDGTINYYLHDSTDFLKEDGVTPSILDGTDGDVMNQRKFYYRTAIKDNVHVNWMSPYPLPGYALYENLTGRYKASINRTTGKIHSVINNSPQFRGGNNTSAWDSDGRSLLGCAVSSISRVTFRSGARIDRAIECNGTPEHDDFFARLIYARVKWATHNFQLPFNPMLDANGYYQGGFGGGTTNLNATKWKGYNVYNPFIPCGYTAEFGNGSGVKDFVMPFEYDGYNTTLSQQKYVGVHDSARIYATGEYVSDSLDTYKGSGDALLYLCILDAPAGTSLTNTTYFSLVDRTVTQAIRMDGEEQWFGEIWEHYANVIIEHNADVEPKTSKAYIFNNPSQIAETRTGNEEFLCDLPITDGYIKEFNADSIFPISTGGGSTTYGCDYYYCNYPASGIATRGCLGGGLALNGSSAGPSCSNSRTSPSLSSASIGGRLVRKSKNIVIIDD